jgi:hypothetical protein
MITNKEIPKHLLFTNKNELFVRFADINDGIQQIYSEKLH